MKNIFLKIKVIFLVLAILSLVGCGGGGVGWHHQRRIDIRETEGVSSIPSEAKNIVLMLPLKGKFASKGQAIRNGFLAAYYHDRKENPEVSIKVFDTTSKDIESLYQEAITGGAEVVVGPLTKKEVEQMLVMSALPIPVIALNTLDNYATHARQNLYQFGLLPQDEATQVASKMVDDQSDQVAIITPDNVWGEKIAEAFKNRYETYGGQVVAVLSYNMKANLSEQLCYFLAQDPDELCISKKKRREKEKEREKNREEGEEKIPDSSETMRRQDINSIFLISNAKNARQIVPLLKFYYAGDLPVYSISSVYGGAKNPRLDRDLDGINFCDMPWVLKDPKSFSVDLQSIYENINSLWKDSFASNGKLYALGVDAYILATGLNRFLAYPEYGLEGSTGVLYLDNFNHIYRKLDWARMKNGVPVVTH